MLATLCIGHSDTYQLLGRLIQDMRDGAREYCRSDWACWMVDIAESHFHSIVETLGISIFYILLLSHNNHKHNDISFFIEIISG